MNKARAFFHLSRMWLNESALRPEPLKTIDDLSNVLRPHFLSSTNEKFAIALFDGANRVIDTHALSTGGDRSVLVDTREVISLALSMNARSFAIAHNHPSGKLKPSLADHEVNEKLSKAANIMGISFSDHLIFAPKEPNMKKDYISMRNDYWFPE